MPQMTKRAFSEKIQHLLKEREAWIGSESMGWPQPRESKGPSQSATMLLSLSSLILIEWIDEKGIFKEKWVRQLERRISSNRNIFKLKNLLDYGCFTVLCSFLLFSKVNQLYVYAYPLFFGFPFHLGYHRVELPELYCSLSVVIYFVHSSVYMSVSFF